MWRRGRIFLCVQAPSVCPWPVNSSLRHCVSSIVAFRRTTISPQPPFPRVCAHGVDNTPYHRLSHPASPRKHATRLAQTQPHSLDWDWEIEEAFVGRTWRLVITCKDTVSQSRHKENALWCLWFQRKMGLGKLDPSPINW